MEAQPAQKFGSSNELFLSIPAELLTKTFCQLPLFSDVLALAATCKRLRRVWTIHTTMIYHHLAPRCIPCEPSARRFLADQDGLATKSLVLSSAEVVSIIRNSSIVEKAILQFEREIIPKIKGIFSP